jgi:hypothetical protein
MRRRKRTLFRDNLLKKTKEKQTHEIINVLMNKSSFLVCKRKKWYWRKIRATLLLDRPFGLMAIISSGPLSRARPKRITFWMKMREEWHGSLRVLNLSVKGIMRLMRIFFPLGLMFRISVNKHVFELSRSSPTFPADEASSKEKIQRF